MGCYDFFEGNCPKCNEPFEAQTKLFDCCFKSYHLGNKIRFDGSLELKEDCSKCGAKLVAVCEGGILKRYDVEGATTKEGLWGETLDMDDSRQDQFDREVRGRK